MSDLSGLRFVDHEVYNAGKLATISSRQGQHRYPPAKSAIRPRATTLSFTKPNPACIVIANFARSDVPAQ